MKTITIIFNKKTNFLKVKMPFKINNDIINLNAELEQKLDELQILLHADVKSILI